MPQSVTSLARQRQDPLRERYRVDPSEASIMDGARTIDACQRDDPFHGAVLPGAAQVDPWPFGIHRAVGGFHDRANPGDMLCAALAACLDSTIRIVADRLGVRLDFLEIVTAAQADARGTLLVDRSVPVGFQRIHSLIRIRPADPDPRKIDMLVAAAEQSCVILQTLRAGVSARLHLEPGGD